mmetsp:Transcript_54704/g.169389  ORF Transcript_54704/g.169389 Transcript_54704/m.169389 type:complete len:224 (-) Transcript_54704:44-715(-)
MIQVLRHLPERQLAAPWHQRRQGLQRGLPDLPGFILQACCDAADDALVARLGELREALQRGPPHRPLGLLLRHLRDHLGGALLLLRVLRVLGRGRLLRHRHRQGRQPKQAAEAIEGLQLAPRGGQHQGLHRGQPHLRLSVEEAGRRGGGGRRRGRPGRGAAGGHRPRPERPRPRGGAGPGPWRGGEARQRPGDLRGRHRRWFSRHQWAASEDGLTAIVHLTSK